MSPRNVSETHSDDPGLRTAAREVLAHAGAHLESGEETFQALQAVLRQIHGHLESRLGDGGFRNLVELAHRGSIPSHPALERIIVATDGIKILEFLDTPPIDAEDSIPDSSLIDLLARILGLIRDVAQDQDWELVDLWPGLKELQESGILLRPDEPTPPDPRQARDK